MKHFRFFHLLLACIMTVSLFGCAKKAVDGPSWQDQYDLGVRYLSEGNYEEAIIAFTAAIEIDPKRTDAYLKLADVYVEMGDTESAVSILESGYQQTQDEALQEYLDSLTGEPEDPSPVDSVTPFEERNTYQDYASLTAEQKGTLDDMIAALQEKDISALTELAVRIEEQFQYENKHGFSYSGLVTQNEVYKIYAMTSQNAPDNKWITMEIRPQTGMGYFAQIQPEAWLGADAREFEPWGYASCECVDWQPEGVYAQEREAYQYYENETTHVMESGSGTAAGGVILAGTHSGIYENLTTGDVNDFSIEDTYENGHYVFSDGPSQEFWTPFASPGSTFSDLDMIFW